MPRLPGEQDFGGIPSARSGRPIARRDTTAVQAGAEALGRGLVQLGAGTLQIAATVKRKQDEIDAYAVETAFEQWSFEEAKRYDETVRNMGPGQAAGFADRYSGDFTERAKAFMETVPERFRPEVDLRLQDELRSYYGQGIEFERGEQRRFAVTELENTMDNVLLPQIQGAALLDTQAEQQAELNRVVRDGLRLINANPALTPVEREEAGRVWTERAQRAFLGQLPAEDRGGWLGTEPVGLADRIISVESGGDPAARNPNSSAAGLGQFVDGTWLGLIARYRPDVVSQHTSPDGVVDREAILALRTDPALAREMTVRLTEDNTAYLQARGIAATPGNIYLAHFLGAAGATTLLRTGRETPVEEVLPANVIAANRSVLEGKTVGQVIEWAAGRMEGDSGYVPALLTSIPFEDRQLYAQDADAVMVQRRNAEQAAAEAQNAIRLNDLLTAIHDGQAGMVDINAARREGWLTEIGDIERAERMYEDRNKEAIALAQALGYMADPQYTFNSFNSEDRERTDLAFQAMGGTGALLNPATTEEAQTARGESLALLRAVVDRTGMIPQSALEALLGGIYSTNAVVRDAAFTALDAIHNDNASIVQRALGAEYGRFQDWQTLAPLVTPEQLTEALSPTLNPQEQARRDRLRAEGRDLAAEVPVEQIVNHFIRGTFGAGPESFPVDPEQVLALQDDFASLFAERYAVSGNATTARAQALEGLSVKWGVTDVGDQRRLMAYPPENFYPPINGTYDWLQQDLDELVEAEFPSPVQDLPPTAAPWVAEAMAGPLVYGIEAMPGTGGGTLPRYQIVVLDRNGVVHVLTGENGTGYVFDYQRHIDEARTQFDLQRQDAQREDAFDRVWTLPAGQPIPGYIGTDENRAILLQDLDARQQRIDVQRAEEAAIRQRLEERREGVIERLMTLP